MTDGQWRNISLLVSTWSAIFAIIVVVLAGEAIAQFIDDEETLHILAIIGGSMAIAAAAVTPILVYKKMQRMKVQPRKRQDICVSCGYDLRKSDSDACPECGTEFTRNNSAKHGDL